MTLRRCARLLSSLALLLGCCATMTPAAAHPLPGSAVLLDFEAQAVGLELRLPIADLEIGFTHDAADPQVSARRIGQIPFTSAPDRIVPTYGAKLGAYIVRHVRPVAPDGRAWTVQLQDLSLDVQQTPLDIVAHLRLQPPAGAPTQRFRLDYDVITHEVLTHEALVSVRSDWHNGVLSSGAQLLGRIRWVVKSVEVDRPEGDTWSGLKAAIRLGMDHIAEGTDHLMFLFALLLPAPLLASKDRWAQAGSRRHKLWRLAAIVTAFTIGHTLTLIAGSQGWLRLPGPPVELAIAVSILVSAVHAWHPLFPGREPWVAAGFGLVHGAAFASVVAELHFDAWHRTLAMLGFNAGIELMQLAVVAAALPCLLLVCDLSAYRFIRMAGAAFAAATAIGWIIERTLGLGNPLERVVDAIAANAAWTVLSATLFAALFRLASHRPPARSMLNGRSLR